MNEVTVRALIAGWVTGAGVSFITTGVMLVALIQARARGVQWLTGWERVRPAVVGIVFVNGMLILWTMLGLVLGALYLRARVLRPESGLLSPNVAFTVAVVAVLLVSLGLVWFVWRRVGWPVWSIGVCAAAAFGWVLPNLAR